MSVQRLTTQRQLYFATESTEGVDPYVGGDPPGANAVLVTNLSLGPDMAFNARSFVGQIGRSTGNMGIQTNPMLSFTAECRPGGTVITPKLDPVLQSILSTGTLDGGNTVVQAGSHLVGAGPNYLVNVGNATGFSKGNAVAIETGSPSNAWEVCWIVDTVTGGGQNSLTLSRAPSFSLPPATGARVYPSMTYKPQAAGHGSLAFRIYLDASNFMGFLGCKGTMKFDASAPGAVPTLTLNWKAISWAILGGSRPTPTYDSTTPPTPYLFKVNEKAFATKLASWDLRQLVARKRSQNAPFGTFAQVVTDRDLRGYLQAYDVDDGTQFSDWTSGAESELCHQFGKTQFNIVAYQIQKAQRTRVGYGDDNGLTTDSVAFEGNIASGADEVRLAFL